MCTSFVLIETDSFSSDYVDKCQPVRKERIICIVITHCRKWCSHACTGQSQYKEGQARDVARELHNFSRRERC